MHPFETSLLTSLLALSSSSLLNTAEAQSERPLGSPIKLTEEDLLPYQNCTTDDDCIFANNGVCDCANGGDEVSINKIFEDEFKNLFPPMFCTKMAPDIPCGTGAGNVCLNSQCVFQECADRKEARKCFRKQFNSSQEYVVNMVEYEECLMEACAGDPDQNETETVTTRPVPELPSLPELPQSLIVDGKFTEEELEQFQYCETDKDCTYANNGFCDCANGGEEVAVNWNELVEFENIFHSRRRICTRMARELPCGVGAGVICGEDNLCKFETCKNVAGAVACREAGKKEFEVDECARLVCAMEPEPIEPPKEDEEKDRGVFGTIIGNIFGRGKN